MNSAFNIAFERLMPIEGGYVNDPADPGGETKFGISKRSYPKLDIKNLTREEAKAIYKRDFWDRIDGDHLPFDLVYQGFDMAVNSGIENTIRILQRALEVADDGYWGPKTKAAMLTFTEVRGHNDLIMRFLAHRLIFMTRLSNWKDHGKGWAVRIANMLFHGADDSLT